MFNDFYADILTVIKPKKSGLIKLMSVLTDKSDQKQDLGSIVRSFQALSIWLKSRVQQDAYFSAQDLLVHSKCATTGVVQYKLPDSEPAIELVVERHLKIILRNASQNKLLNNLSDNRSSFGMLLQNYFTDATQKQLWYLFIPSSADTESFLSEAETLFFNQCSRLLILTHEIFPGTSALFLHPHWFAAYHSARPLLGIRHFSKLYSIPRHQTLYYINTHPGIPFDVINALQSPQRLRYRLWKTTTYAHSILYQCLTELCKNVCTTAWIGISLHYGPIGRIQVLNVGIMRTRGANPLRTLLGRYLVREKIIICETLQLQILSQLNRTRPSAPAAHQHYGLYKIRGRNWKHYKTEE